jgi:hypothetical protein
MNTIIELNGQSVDLRSIKSVEFKEHPMVKKAAYDIRLNFLSGDQYVLNPKSGAYELIQPHVHVRYSDYRGAARGHSVLIRAWARYREWEERMALLKLVEREVGLAC